MPKINKTYPNLKKIIGVIVGTLIYSIAVVWLLDMGKFFAGGITGISQIISRILNDFFGVNISMSIFLLFINVPLFVVGWKHVSKRFAMLTLLSVILQSVFIYSLEILRDQFGFQPFLSLSINFEANRLLIAVIGGLTAAVGAGICLRHGASTGGMDVIAQYLVMKRDVPFTKYSLTVDVVIISLSGILFDINTAIYTVVRMIIYMLVIDRIYTIYKYMKVTIVTEREEEMSQAFTSQFQHGVTIFKAIGAYHRKERAVLEIVVLTYEVPFYVETAQKIDPSAFISVVEVKVVRGKFNKRAIT